MGEGLGGEAGARGKLDRKSTRLNSSHGYTSYAVFCLKKKTTTEHRALGPADPPLPPLTAPPSAFAPSLGSAPGLPSHRLCSPPSVSVLPDHPAVSLPT